MTVQQGESDKTVGRTRWDFATEVLVRVGPVVVIVAGFLVAVYFFQVEVNKARLQIDQVRLEADKQSQDRVDTAHKTLESTYNTISGMTDQLIENVNSLLKLRRVIDDDLKALTDERDKIEKELRDKKRELKVRDELLAKQGRELAEKKKQLIEKTIELEKKLAETDPVPHDAPITPGRPGLESIVEESDKNKIKESIQISQFANEVNAPKGRENEGRKWYEVIYTVKMKNPQLEEKYSTRKFIEKVVYKFDDKWYSPSERFRRNSRDDFRLSVRVWGRTTVDVEVFLEGFNETVCRSGLMNLEKEPVKYTEMCKNR